ncbi:hypothetical protein [Duganella sp. BJB476]|uniref:hypothetical protein n=1 Tax=Duganella sp. BJB476 TaxID=1871176 RepID=UPI000E34C508|nr:hypothetical protein [Duganella sp. BJB476]RFP36157.1 hypothetical protein D0T21_06905 [Duganella sp. BJB476]
MQSYDFKLDPVVLRTRTIFNDADLFVYESGATTPINGETRILVTPENGSQIVLRPGQRFRITKQVNAWTIQPYDPAATLTGSIIIGSGEFDDANTLNKVTLDATFANTVTVTNSLAAPVNVALNPATLLKLDTSTPLNIAGTTVQYTNSFIDATIVAATATQIFSAAQNPNGAYIEFAEIAISTQSANSACVVTLLAKATAPASGTDGDAVMLGVCGGGGGGGISAQNLNQMLGQRIKIAAGKGLYLNQQVSASAVDRCVKTVLFTLL